MSFPPSNGLNIKDLFGGGNVSTSDQAPSVVWEIRPPVGRADIPGLCEQVTSLLAQSGATVVLCDLTAIDEPDGATVEAMARLHLIVRRLGHTIRFAGMPHLLEELVLHTGLGGILHLRWQAEQREQVLGVEEVVDPGDEPV